jgi:hypothetical protein
VAEDPASLRAAAPALRALANNREFLAQRIHEELLGDLGFQRYNPHTAQTLLLGSGEGFVVRANIWMPLAQKSDQRDWQQRLFFYSVAHDHNFDLLSVGYHGPGYETDLYEYERAAIAGLPGEPVRLDPRGRATLARGTVMLYRASRDVHVQHPPAAFSVSLNLLTLQKRRADQLYFDIERGCVSDSVDSASPEHSFLCAAACHFADARTAPLLERIATQHPSGRTRVAALSSLASLDPANAERLWTRAGSNDHALVRSVSRTRLEAWSGKCDSLS